MTWYLWTKLYRGCHPVEECMVTVGEEVTTVEAVDIEDLIGVAAVDLTIVDEEEEVVVTHLITMNPATTVVIQIDIPPVVIELMIHTRNLIDQ